MHVLDRIKVAIENMTPMQKRIGEFILNNPENSFRMSISALTHKIGIRSESTIVRFYRELGFESYHDFKVTLATEIAGKAFYHTYEDITSEDSIGVVKKKLFEGTAKTLMRNIVNIDNELLEQSVRLINSSNRLVLVGFAASGAVAFDAFFRFSRIGLNCFFSSDPHINAVVLADPKEGDVILSISFSGESKDAVIPVARAKPYAKVIAITGSADSALGNIADICIPIATEELAFRTDAMIARIVQMTVIGTIFTGVCLLRSPESLRHLEKTKQALSYLKY